MKKITKEIRKLIIDYRAINTSYKDIQSYLGVSSKTIAKVVKDSKIELEQSRIAEYENKISKLIANPKFTKSNVITNKPPKLRVTIEDLLIKGMEEQKEIETLKEELRITKLRLINNNDMSDKHIKSLEYHINTTSFLNGWFSTIGAFAIICTILFGIYYLLAYIIN